MAEGQWRRGEVTGASLRGPWQQQQPFRGMAPGTVRNKGWFWLGAGPDFAGDADGVAYRCDVAGGVG